jgi:TPP-dependent pyruvate/acetoin dehydrogenase alpha subunit
VRCSSTRHARSPARTDPNLGLRRKGDSGKLTKQVDAAVKRSRAEMIESTAASREEFEGVKRAAEEAIRADAAKLEAATRE